MVAVDPGACAGCARYGMPRPDGLKAIGLDCVCYADRAHLNTCRCSDFVRLEGGFGLIFIFILSDYDESNKDGCMHHFDAETGGNPPFQKNKMPKQ